MIFLFVTFQIRKHEKFDEFSMYYNKKFINVYINFEFYAKRKNI